jgi:hypothetical protein
MTFDETVLFMADHVGKTIEALPSLPVPGREEPVHLVGCMGVVDRITRSSAGALAEAWYARLRREDGPSAGSLRLDRELFESAEREGARSAGRGAQRVGHVVVADHPAGGVIMAS